LIVGRTLTSLLYAWRLQRDCILTEPFSFHPFSSDFDGVDLSEFGVDSPQQLANNLIFLMALSGNLKHQGNISAVRPNLSMIITKGNSRIVYPDEFEAFDGDETGKFEVFDEFYWKRGESHQKARLLSGDDFCSRVLFYSSKRTKVKKITKDFTVVSTMNRMNLSSANFSPGIVGIKTRRMFNKAGLRGNFNRRTETKEYFKKIKFDFASRIAIPIVKQKMSFREVINLDQKEGKAWKMHKKLTSKREIWLG
tara:strand:+ start:7161 stop:7916 length:756 start_codon:yes stop_codon:yes gene_type:complete